MTVPIINKQIQQLRKAQGLTQEKTAKLIFKSKPTIARYDTGDIMPESVLQQLCNLLKLDLQELLKAQEKDNQENNTNFYSDLIEKYKNINVVISPRIAPIRSRALMRCYDIEILKAELYNYLSFKDEFLKIESTDEEKDNKIEKILSFIDFLYFQDIIKK